MAQGDLTRENALWILGLEEPASEQQILKAYSVLSRPLKRMLVTAGTVDAKDRFRADLLGFVRARDAALGRARPESRELGMAAEPLLARLERLELDTLDRGRALELLDLAPGADADTVYRAYAKRYRVLTRSLGGSTDNAELARLQEGRRRMRAIRKLVVAEPRPREDPFAEDDDLTSGSFSDVQLAESRPRVDLREVELDEDAKPPGGTDSALNTTMVEPTDVRKNGGG